MQPVAGAHERGFEVTLVEDGHTTFNGKSKTASEIVESINGGPQRNCQPNVSGGH